MTSIPTPAGRTSALSLGGPTRSAGGRERLWVPAGILVAALLALSGWLLVVSPVRDDASALRSQAGTASTQVDTLRSQLATLEAEQADFPRYRAELEAARAALPTTTALPDFLRRLQQIGTVAGVEVTTLTAQAPTAIDAAGAPAAAAAGAAPASLYQVAVTVAARGGYDNLTSFVRQLQQVQPRAVLVSNVAEQSTADSATLTVTLSAFFAPDGGATAGS